MGGFGVYWVSEVADLGLLPLLVGMGDLDFGAAVRGLVFWPLVGGKDSLRHALWSSFVPCVCGVFAFGHG